MSKSIATIGSETVQLVKFKWTRGQNDMTFYNISISMLCLFYIFIWQSRKFYVFLPVSN